MFRTVGWYALSPATISATGSVTGKRCMSTVPLENVGWKEPSMNGFLAAVLVTVAAALIERLAVHVVRCLWGRAVPGAA